VLAYSLAVAVVRWQHLRHCVARDGTASPDWCSAAWDFGILRIQVPEHGVWPLLGPLLVAWGLILTLWLVAGSVDLYLYNLKLYYLPLRSGEADTADTIVFEPRDKRSFKWRRSHRWSPFKACRWNPPRTDCPEEMRVYAADRSLIPVRNANGGLFSDITLQPFTVVAAVLLLYTAAVASLGPDGVSLPIFIGVGGALSTLTTGWVWWRKTNTFMTKVCDWGSNPLGRTTTLGRP
jgi:hypothetical protein